MTLPFERPTLNSLVSEQSLKTLHRFHSLFRKLGVRLALGKLNGASADLRRVLPKLPQASSYLEQQFLNFQTALEQLSDASRDLIFHGQKVVTMASGREMGDVSFDSVFALLEAPLAR